MSARAHQHRQTRHRGIRAFPAFLLVALLFLVPSAALADGLEVSEVRSENYPRIIVRFSANEPDGTPISTIKPGQLKVWENGAAQSQVDLYSLRESSSELWVTLVMDVSGSMNDEDRLNQGKEAAKAFVSRLRTKDRTAIVTFSDRVVLQQQPTGDPGVLRRAIDSLQAKGATRMNDGLARGVAEALRGREGARRAIILLSDGEDTDSQTDLASALSAAVDAKLPVYTVGLGTESTMDVLKDIANQTRGRYYAAPKATDLDFVFKLLSGQLSSQYEAWWQSSTAVPGGTPVQGRLAIEVPGIAPVESNFGYIMPTFIRPQVVEQQVAQGGALQSVELNNPGTWNLPPGWELFAALMAAAGACVAFYGLILRLTRTQQQSRLANFVGSYQGSKARVIQSRASAGDTIRPMVLNIAGLTHKMMPTRVLDDLRHRLVLAGRPTGWHFAQFLASKLILASILAIGSYVFVAASTQSGWIAFGIVSILAILGYYLPHPWLGAQIRSRQHAIQRALPDALDLLTVGVGAGLSLDGAILEVVEKSHSQLSHELSNFLAELRMGRSRREALQGLQARTEVEDIKVLVASLVQAEELGMSLSDTLMVQADQMRQRRRQRAEELAHKATLKMMFPMILLIFPALFVVIMGPAVPGLMGFMGGGT